MENIKLKKELIRATNKRPSDFWGYMIAWTSICHGLFLFRYDYFLITHAEPYLSKLPGRWIGFFLFIAGVMKVIGLVAQSKRMKEWSIWLLSSIWGGLWFVSLTFAFGTGYPDPFHIFIFFLFVGCLRVSLKGDYVK